MGQRLTRAGFLFSLFLTTCAVARGQLADSSPLPDDRLGIRTAPMLLLSRPDVRADLGLSPEQAHKAEKAVTELYIRAAAVKGKTGAQAVAARKEIDDAQRIWFTANLSQKQRNRLVQLDMQWEGPSALVSRVIVANALGLAPHQISALEDAVAKRDDARARGKYTPENEKVLSRQARSILTSQQWETWLSMLGRPFEPHIATASTKNVR